MCGKKIEPGVTVDLKQGDTFTLGVSTRVYFLHFVSQLDAEAIKKNIGSLCCDDDEENSQSKGETFDVQDDSFGTGTSCCDGENNLCECQICFLSPPYVHSVDEVDNKRVTEACSEVEMPGDTNLLCTLKEYVKQNICIPGLEAVQGTKLRQESSVEKQWIDPAASFDENCDDASVDVITEESEFGCSSEDSYKFEDILTSGARVFNSEDMSDSESHQTNAAEEVSVDSFSDGEKQDICGEQYESELQNPNAKSCHEQLDEIVEDIGNKWIENVDPASSDENGEAAVNVTPLEHRLGCISEENDDRINDVLTSIARTFVSEKTSSLVEEAIPVINFQQIEIVEEIAVDSLSDGEKQNQCDKEFQTYLNAKPCDGESNSLDEIADDTMQSFQTEPLSPAVPQEADLKITDKKENQTPQYLIAESCVEQSSEKSTTFVSDIRSRRDKAASAPQDRIRKSRLLNTPNVDTKFAMSNLKDIKIMKPRDLFCVLYEEEMFTPNNENSSPTNTFHLQFMRKKDKLEGSKRSKSQKSHNLKANVSPNFYSSKRSTSPNIYSKSQWSHNLKANFSPNVYSAERSTSAISNKENQTPIGWNSGKKPLEKKRVERIPLQSLMSSGSNHNSMNSSPFSAAKTIVGGTARARNCGHISYKHNETFHISKEQKRSWDMVVDSTSLLNKESRKALQLLQGLKGTRLIIPESVIRELGSMKQQVGIFRRISEAVLALEWIEECLVKSNWWIHIQSSMVEENHILDFALQCRRKYNDGQLVLLSDDVTLKIKSMEKGLRCETVQQFQQSLVNPFSKRFMWENSSPRGLTWSCQDDVVLKEKYCGLPSKAGLKLLVTQKFVIASSN